MALCTHCRNVQGLATTQGVLVQAAPRGALLGRQVVVRASMGAASYQDVSTAVDYRRVLGVGPNASKCEVKAAFRKLALRYHPDVCKGDECRVNFMEVNRAYESLMAMSSFGCGDQSLKCDGEEEMAADSGYVFQEDYSCYYSNLKYYSKPGRNRRYTGSSPYYGGN